MPHLCYVFGEEGSGRPYSRPATITGHSDNCCVVFDDSKLVFASETERFSKVKHDRDNAHFALESFLLHNRLTYSDVEHYLMPNNEHHQHENHIYESFYQSGFDEAAVLVNDKHGDHDDCITLAYLKQGEQPTILQTLGKNNSPCKLYYDVSFSLFNHENSEGKLMGLAAYGKDNGKKYAKWEEQSKQICVDLNSAKEDISEAMQNTHDVMAAKDIAFTVQKNFEDVLVEVVKHFKQLLDDAGISTTNLCMSGGGILNCPTNSRIIDLGLFGNYYASPQPTDGCAESIGRFFRAKCLMGDELTSIRLTNPYLGVAYPAEELTSPHSRVAKAQLKIMTHLREGGVVSWCQGEAEYGPRALGHRSFLADPTNKEMADALNKIKGRESWRPLAPIVPDRLFSLIFEEKNTDMCEFMLRTLKVKDEWQCKLKAICHIDGTTRPQILHRELNPLLWDLLMAYFNETGVPCLINTSLNINGFPMVETPRDFCNLTEEVKFKSNVPDVLSIFIEGKKFFELN